MVLKPTHIGLSFKRHNGTQKWPVVGISIFRDPESAISWIIDIWIRNADMCWLYLYHSKRMLRDAKRASGPRDATYFSTLHYAPIKLLWKQPLKTSNSLLPKQSCPRPMVQAAIVKKFVAIHGFWHLHGSFPHSPRDKKRYPRNPPDLCYFSLGNHWSWKGKRIIVKVKHVCRHLEKLGISSLWDARK